jgi:hypothetical protein
MTNKHPITPPHELLLKWGRSSNGWYEAAQWGADQELEACCLLLDIGEHSAIFGCHDGTSLRAARRPKPPSLKEQALKALAAIEGDFNTVGDRADTIRRALEALDA